LKIFTVNSFKTFSRREY